MTNYFTERIRGTALLVTLLLICSAAASGAETQTTKRFIGKRISKDPVRWQASRNATIKLDPRLLKAVEIAMQRARKHSSNRCWRYVKKALVEAELVDRYPGTRYAKQAGAELKQFGFQPLEVEDPFQAPVGSILVYGGNGPGHVEFRTQCGFVSDFLSTSPSPRPLIGVYVKMRDWDI